MEEAHEDAINCLDFNHRNDFSLITGSADNTVGLWDIRDLSRKLFHFDYHKESVINVKWNPKMDSVFASGSEDCQILIWDTTQIGCPMALDDYEDGPPELLVRQFVFLNYLKKLI